MYCLFFLLRAAIGAVGTTSAAAIAAAALVLNLFVDLRSDNRRERRYYQH